MSEVKVTLHPAPQDGPASETAEVLPDDIVVDARGRKLKIKDPDILRESRLVKVMGDAASNVAYMTGYVTTAAMVVEIDGEPVPFPMSEKEVDAAIVRLGREGIMAVVTHLNKQAEAAAAKARADAKNS